MKSRVTITMRHTGRIYLGMDGESFAALYGIALSSGIVSTICPSQKATDVARDRVRKAIVDFATKLKSQGGNQNP